MLGSFVGVIYHRKIASHTKQDIILLKSHCDNCNKNLSVWELFPVISYLFLRGHCRHCKFEIPKQYFYIEIIFLLISINILLLPLHVIEAYIVLVVITLLITQTLSDFKNKELFSYASLLIGMLGLIQSSIFSTYSSLYSSLAGMIIGFLSLFAINKIFNMVKKRDGIGKGDFFLFGSILAIHGLEMFGPILLIASCITLGIGYLTSSLQSEMPLGSGLAIAGILFLLLPF